jgi:aspartate/methionine/tyrosine aminotransferase
MSDRIPMRVAPFALERYFAAHEFSARYLLSASDCEGLHLSELLALADPAALGLWETLSLGYTESQGHPLLRREIAGLYSSVSEDHILVAAPEEAIFIAMNTLLGPGDHVIVISPAYQSLYEVAAALGCRVSRWPIELHGDRWRLDPNRLGELCTPETRLIVINFPHNPTGYLPEREVLDEILLEAAQHGIPVFSDEMYRLLEFDEGRRLPSLVDVYDGAIVLSGLSKTFSLPGLRIGWLATRNRGLLDRFAGFKDYTSICSSAPSEILGIIALRAAHAIVQRNLGIITGNLVAAEQLCARHAGLFAWIPPLAGSVAFPRLTAHLPVRTFCDDVLRRRGVMIVSGDMFGWEGNHFRVGLGRVNLPQALEQVEDYILEADLRN